MKDFKGQEDCAGVLMLLVFFFFCGPDTTSRQESVDLLLLGRKLFTTRGGKKSHPLLSALLVSYKKCGTEIFCGFNVCVL